LDLSKLNPAFKTLGKLTMTHSVTASLIFANTCLGREFFHLSQMALQYSESKYATTVTPSGGGHNLLISQFYGSSEFSM
jgi:hypothetical protein